jgi:hypothetical protein
MKRARGTACGGKLALDQLVSIDEVLSVDDGVGDLAIDYYRYALLCREFIPDDQLIAVRYVDLVNDPRSTVDLLYRHLDLQMSPAFQVRLDVRDTASGSMQST